MATNIVTNLNLFSQVIGQSADKLLTFRGFGWLPGKNSGQPYGLQKSESSRQPACA